MKNRNIILSLFAQGCVALCPMAQAVVPAPDGGYPGGNTAEGQNALLSLNVNTGTNNTAIGFFSLKSNVEGQYNTAVGAGTLFNNTADRNTAIGGAAMFSNTTGIYNTAVGLLALFNNSIGGNNTAIGDSALFSNTTGDFNTATGFYALRFNTTGVNNTASGLSALEGNIDGNNNTANGAYALLTNTTGSGNTANGAFALNNNSSADSNTANGAYALSSNMAGGSNTASGFNALRGNTNGGNNTANGRSALVSNTTGISNTASGVGALLVNNTGDYNVALGFNAGTTVTSGSGNVFIGAVQDGAAADESNHTYIRNINTTLQSFFSGVNNYVTVRMSDGRLGYTSVVSSRRYKEDIKPLAMASEALYALKPVSFRLKKEYDETQALSFGLIAEEVQKVDPTLVYHSDKGQAESVRYEMVNAMVLNEFLKQHKTVQEQGKTIARLENQIEALTAGLRKVNAQIQINKTVPTVVRNNQ